MSQPNPAPTAPTWAMTGTAPYAEEPPATAPALKPPTWSGRKTAIAAALAIGISAAGAVGAAAAVPHGTSHAGDGFQQGGFGPGGQTLSQLPGGQP
jgi:hypothetical protein